MSDLVAKMVARMMSENLLKGETLSTVANVTQVKGQSAEQNDRSRFSHSHLGNGVVLDVAACNDAQQ